jgi:hypothetical protein
MSLPITADTPLATRAATARHTLLGAACLGLLADLLLRDEPWGVGLLVWMAALAVVTVTLVRSSGRPIDRESGVWLAVIIVCAAGQSWRDADVLHGFDFLAMLAAMVLLATSLAGFPVTGLAAARIRDLVRAAFGTGLSVGIGAVPLALRDAEFDASRRTADGGRPRQIVRAVVLTVPLLVVFTLLLTNADPVFGRFFTLPDVALDVVVSHILVPGFFAWVVAGWLRRALLATPDDRESSSARLPFSLGVTDVTVSLGALTLLFAAFVAVQVQWLFGGEALVLKTTGLTYAEYARRGFAELTGVAALLLPVLLIAHALIPAADARTHARYRRLAVPLVLLLGAIMVSAGARMRLYVQFYGISSDRLFASAFMIWLAIVFVWLTLTVLSARPRAFALGLVVSAFAVLGTLNVLNPDALVARSILARTEAPPARRADVRYLAMLGGDAVPLLVATLTAPAPTADSTSVADRCAAAERVLKRWTGERADRMQFRWTQWNSARHAALDAVQAHEGALRALACPQTTAGR